MEAVVWPWVRTPIVFASTREMVTCRLSQDMRLQARGVFGCNDSITSKNASKRKKITYGDSFHAIVRLYGGGGDGS